MHSSSRVFRRLFLTYRYASILPFPLVQVMILMEDREQGRLTLTTKRLEKTPGDMVRNPQLVFDGADEMAKAFRARMEAIAMGADTMSMDELLGSRDGYEPMPFLPPTQTQVITSKDNTLYKF